MSNLEVDPQELICTIAEDGGRIELVEPRLVPLGGPRAMPVRRTLPRRGRTLIGAWCFLDHYGPDDVGETGGMDVPPHPHAGLQTVSWLFHGEIEHRDSTGAHAIVRPGELNLMTAGAGIQHSEVSTRDTRILHGVQLWTALPDAHRDVAPFFERYVPPVLEHESARVSVFLGRLLGSESTATAFSPLVGAQFDLPPETTVRVPVEPGFEHGVLLDTGQVSLDGVAIPEHHLAYRGPGSTELVLAAGSAPTRILLIGGEPLGEQFIMWWNFIGRSHDEVVAYREQWQAEVVGGATAEGRFGEVVGYGGPPLPAPPMPTLRLRPRG